MAKAEVCAQLQGSRFAYDEGRNDAQTMTTDGQKRCQNEIAFRRQADDVDFYLFLFVLFSRSIGVLFPFGSSDEISRTSECG